MASSTTLPEQFKILGVIKPATDAAGRTGRYVSLKNCTKAWIIAYIDQGNAATIALTPKQASAVAGTGSKVLSSSVPIWANLDIAASDVQVRQTDATSFTTDAGVKEKQVIFQIDPATLDQANGFDCIGLTTGASNVANLTSALVVAEMTYAQATPPSASVD
jgi:hypothetical protein